MKKALVIVLSASLLFSGCKSMSNLAEGLLIGTGSGAAVGAGVGALVGGDAQSAAIGSAIGATVGAAAGALIGKKMDKKAEELAALENAAVETVTDVNDLEAIKVTFSSGILFKTNSAKLSAESEASLKEFAETMSDLPDTDITILGHTDNTGTAAVNEKLSAQRAESVASYLKKCGIANDRMTTEGRSYNDPVASNETVEGRAQNRRVEIFISANEKMIEDAKAGTLQ